MRGQSLDVELSFQDHLLVCVELGHDKVERANGGDIVERPLWGTWPRIANYGRLPGI